MRFLARRGQRYDPPTPSHDASPSHQAPRWRSSAMRAGSRFRWSAARPLKGSYPARCRSLNTGQVAPWPAGGQRMPNQSAPGARPGGGSRPARAGCPQVPCRSWCAQPVQVRALMFAARISGATHSGATAKTVRTPLSSVLTVPSGVRCRISRASHCAHLPTSRTFGQAVDRGRPAPGVCRSLAKPAMRGQHVECIGRHFGLTQS